MITIGRCKTRPSLASSSDSQNMVYGKGLRVHGRVCNDEFICYLGATGYRNNPFQAAVTGGIVWKNVVCTGSETKLGDCRRTNNTAGCTHFSDVGVSCSSCKDVAHPSCMHAHDSHLGCTIASSNQAQEYLVHTQVNECDLECRYTVPH